MEFWLVTVPLCKYNENSCTLKKESGGHCPRVPWDTEVLEEPAGSPGSLRYVFLRLRLIGLVEAVSLPPAWGPMGLMVALLPVDSSASGQVWRESALSPR